MRDPAADELLSLLDHPGYKPIMGRISEGRADMRMAWIIAALVAPAMLSGCFFVEPGYRDRGPGYGYGGGDYHGGYGPGPGPGGGAPGGGE